MAEMKLELRFVTTASEAIMPLPAVAVLHRRMHRTLSGAAGAFGGHWIGAAAPASDSSMRATESPDALLGMNPYQLTGNIEPLVSPSSHLELLGRPTQFAFKSNIRFDLPCSKNRMEIQVQKSWQ
jgi:hypothetical protein